MKPDVRRTTVAADTTPAAFPAVKQEFRILLGEAAFDAVVAHGSGDTTREVGGILVGQLLSDDCGPYIRVDAAIEALHADEKGAELTFTHATWEHVNKQMDSGFAGSRILGWYHTHPGFGVFLSDRDRFIHRSFFGEPFQIAFVYDPTRREHGVFAWRDGEPRRWRRYAVGDREHSYDGPLTDGAGDKAGSNAKSAKLVKPGKGETNGHGKPGDADGEGGDAASAARDDDEIESARGPRGGAAPDPRATLLYGLGIAFLCLIVGVLGGTWYAGRATETLLLQARDQFMQAQLDTSRQSIAAVGEQMADVLRAGLGDSIMTKALAEVSGRIRHAEDLATKAVDKNASVDTRQEAQKALGEAGAAIRNLETSWGSAQTMLNRLDQATHALANPGTTGKELDRQRSLLGLLFSELAEQAVHERDLPRADRLLLTAADAHPQGRDRYQRRRSELGLGGAPPAPAPAAGKGP